ncbi:hypothetical protein HispidOSU_007939 [Sigmodon hispidus]
MRRVGDACMASKVDLRGVLPALRASGRRQRPRRSRSQLVQREQKLSRALRDDEGWVSGEWRTGIGRIKRMQNHLQEASGPPGWAGPGYPSRDWHLQPPHEPRVVGAPGAPRSGRRGAADPGRLFPATAESRAPEQLEFGSEYHLAICATAGTSERWPRLRGPRAWRRHRGSDAR